jgi:hypothetical protein
VTDYRAAVAAIRTERDQAIERAHSEANRRVAELAMQRDAEIRRLRAEDPSMTVRAIASLVGVGKETVHQTLNPDARERYNRRRREHWRSKASESSLT